MEEIRRAVQATPRHRLADLSATLWKGFAGGTVSETDAQALAEEIEARKAESKVEISTLPRRVGSRPRSSGSMARRRSWAAGSWMPPSMAAGFTTAENAALAVIVREIATTGSCGLAAAAIAGKAGISTTSARNAVREARKRGILHVEERRVAYDRNRPNLITIASKELALWVRTRVRDQAVNLPLARREQHTEISVPSRVVGGGVKLATPSTNHYLHSPA